MSVEVQLALIPALVAIAVAWLDYRARTRHRRSEKKLQVIEQHTNSIVAKLVKKKQRESFARGKATKKPGPKKRK